MQATKWAVCLTSALLYCGWVSAAQFVVNNVQDVPDDDPGDGICRPVNAIPGTCTLRAAIMEANALPGGHSIVLPSGTYVLNNVGILEDQAVTGDLDIHKFIHIVSFDEDRPIISGDFKDRVFDVHPGGSLVLENINIVAGYANDADNVAGGAIRVADGATLQMFRTNVSASIANVGGVIYNNGTVLIDRSEFFNNVLVGGQLTPEPRTGTAIRNRGHLTIKESTFHTNGLIPGGIDQILTNRYTIDSDATGTLEEIGLFIRNSTFFDNTNGIFSSTTPTEVLGSTLVNNNLRGLHLVADQNNLGELQHWIARTVLYGHDLDCNSLPLQPVAWLDTSMFNASSDSSCRFGAVGSFQDIDYPFLGEAGDFGGLTPTFMPDPNGILVDPPGSDCESLNLQLFIDQRGVARPLDGNGDGTALCDIGAVEYNPAIDPLPDALFSDRFEL